MDADGVTADSNARTQYTAGMLEQREERRTEKVFRQRWAGHSTTKFWHIWVCHVLIDSHAKWSFYGRCVVYCICCACVCSKCMYTILVVFFYSRADSPSLSRSVSEWVSFICSWFSTKKNHIVFLRCNEYTHERKFNIILYTHVLTYQYHILAQC